MFNLIPWYFIRGMGGGDGRLESDFAEKFCIIFKVCVCTDRVGRGQPNVGRCGQTGGVGGGGGQSLVKMRWHPFRLAPSFSHGDIMIVNRSNN